MTLEQALSLGQTFAIGGLTYLVWMYRKHARYWRQLAMDMELIHTKQMSEMVRFHLERLDSIVYNPPAERDGIQRS